MSDTFPEGKSKGDIFSKFPDFGKPDARLIGISTANGPRKYAVFS